jgi:hypothetical protein
MEKYTLKLRSVGRSKDSIAPITESDPSYLDNVEGLPSGEEALIMHNRQEGIWQIARKKNGVRGAFAGNYKSVEDALAAIQNEVDSEHR